MFNFRLKPRKLSVVCSMVEIVRLSETGFCRSWPLATCSLTEVFLGVLTVH